MMETFFNTLRIKYKQGDIVVRGLFFLALVFIFMRFCLLLLKISGASSLFFMTFFELPSDLSILLYKPWTVFSYMFVHISLIHLLMNMLWLYIFGRFCLNWFNYRQLLVIYLVSGISGALFFIGAYHFLPIYEGFENTGRLIGASASIMGLCAAAVGYKPNYSFMIPFLGSVKLKYIIFVIIAIDLLSIDANNAGQTMAHIGGFCCGLVLGFYYSKNLLSFSGRNVFGKNISNWSRNSYSSVNNFFLRKGRAFRMGKETTNKVYDADQEYRDLKKSEENRIDDILDKVKRSGYESLSKKEKKDLFNMGKNKS